MIALTPVGGSEVASENGEDQARRERNRVIDIVDVIGVERRLLRHGACGKERTPKNRWYRLNA